MPLGVTVNVVPAPVQVVHTIEVGPVLAGLANRLIAALEANAASAQDIADITAIGAAADRIEMSAKTSRP